MKKILLFIVLAFSIFFLARYTNLSNYLNFNFLKSQQLQFIALFESEPLKVSSLFVAIYIFITAFSLPGAAVLTLAAGAAFGLWKGVVLVSFASSIGALFAFLLSRYFFRGFVESRFKEKLKSINQGVEKEGALYLLTLRLIPAVPFFIINIAMGLTQIRAWTFYWVSQLGMLPGTIVYVNAGTQLGQIESPSEILSPEIILSLTLLGIFPILMKKGKDVIRKRKVYGTFNKPKGFDYNLVVVGGGSAGLVSSYISAAVRSKTALIEMNKMGGDCLNTGCVPSKALISCSKRPELRGSENFQAVMEKVKKSISKIAPHDSVERYQSLGVECFKGEAEIISPWEVKCGERILKTKNIILAVGAEPFVPFLPGINEVNFRTSDTIWRMERLPERLVILGGGNIGCELAQAFSRLGSKVTIIERHGRLLARDDEDASAYISRKFEREGITVLLNHEAKEFGKHPNGQFITAEKDGNLSDVPFDECLIALGRKARTSVKGLERLSLKLTPQGTFEHDEYLRTRFPNIYVCGDCAGPFQFTHTASHQAWYASVNALFSPFKSFSVDYRVIPKVTFTDPEIAQVGLNEQEAEAQGLDFEVTRYELDDLDRAITEEKDEGFVKVITEKGKDKILGAVIAGPRAGDVLAEFTLAMKWKIGLNKILSTIHPYPTYSESVKYAAGRWKQKNKPERLLKIIEKFHRWRRS